MAAKETPYYFPTKDADVGPWARNFVTVLLANAARWGITGTLVTALSTLVTIFETAYAKHMDPDSGKVSTKQKNLALAALKQGVQDMVNGHINYNPLITADERIALGLYTYKPNKSPILKPDTTVVLRTEAGLAGEVVVYFTDSATPERRRKPFGVDAVELACGIFDSPPSGVEVLPRYVTASKSPLRLICREEDRGKRVYMAGRWKTRRQLAGPWSEIISAIIP
jgi:hypothetical protein